MSRSYEAINYYYRPNKQVERKIIIDILQGYRSLVNIENYRYIGMGSIYFYDFILLHKNIGIKDLISIENSTSTKRFNFNKPYDFIDFINEASSDFLSSFDFTLKPSIIWLDYDKLFTHNRFIFPDLSIISKRAQEKDFFILSVNSIPPENDEEKDKFMDEFSLLISENYKKKMFTTPKYFHYLLQNIIINQIAKDNEYSEYKFQKIFSFYYKDGAPMYTLGGVFTSNKKEFIDSGNKHKDINFDKDHIEYINVPKITYKEKFYLDSKITELQKWIEKGYKTIEEKNIEDDNEKRKIFKRVLMDNMAFELSKEEVENYISNYKYFPQYYEGIL